MFALVAAMLLPVCAFAQAPKDPPVPVPLPNPNPTFVPPQVPKPPAFIGYPVRGINAATPPDQCNNSTCTLSCEKGKEIIVSAVCNNHRTIGGPGDGPQPGPEIQPKYLNHYQARCEAAAAPGMGDSMIALCVRADMLGKIPYQQ
jgi:hypothetical protein